MTSPSALAPSRGDVAAGRYIPRSRWSADQHATYAAALAALERARPARLTTAPERTSR